MIRRSSHLQLKVHVHDDDKDDDDVAIDCRGAHRVKEKQALQSQCAGAPEESGPGSRRRL